MSLNARSFFVCRLHNSSLTVRNILHCCCLLCILLSFQVVYRCFPSFDEWLQNWLTTQKSSSVDSRRFRKSERRNKRLVDLVVQIVPQNSSTFAVLLAQKSTSLCLRNMALLSFPSVPRVANAFLHQSLNSSQDVGVNTALEKAPGSQNNARRFPQDAILTTKHAMQIHPLQPGKQSQ